MSLMHKIINAVLFAAFFMAVPIMARSLYFEYAPIEWFVQIDKIEAKQINDQAVLYFIYRNVKYEMGGRFNRTLFCAGTQERLGDKSGTLTFNRLDENLEQIRIPIDESFDPKCSSYLFRVDYYLRMPNGSERKFPTMYTNVFDIQRDTKGAVSAPTPNSVPKNAPFTPPQASKSSQEKPSKVEVVQENRMEEQKEPEKESEPTPEPRKSILEGARDLLGI